MIKIDLEITSAQNPKIKKISQLRKKRTRDEEKKFLIEGYRELFRAKQAGVPIEELYICPEFFLGENEQELISSLQSKNTLVYQLPQHLFAKFSYRDRPDGLLALAKQWESSIDTLKKLANKGKALWVVAVSIEKPGNLGTILRSADACGATGVIVCDECTDIFNPNVVRASTGTLFTQAVLNLSSQSVIEYFKESQTQIVATTPSANQYYTELDFTQASAIILGCEQYGLPDLWLNQAKVKTKIPMLGQADSLNVAMAATVMLYEALRQRS